MEAKTNRQKQATAKAKAKANSKARAKAKPTPKAKVKGKAKAKAKVKATAQGIKREHNPTPLPNPLPMPPSAMPEVHQAVKREPLLDLKMPPDGPATAAPASMPQSSRPIKRETLLETLLDLAFAPDDFKVTFLTVTDATPVVRQEVEDVMVEAFTNRNDLNPAALESIQELLGYSILTDTARRVVPDTYLVLCRKGNEPLLGAAILKYEHPSCQDNAGDVILEYIGKRRHARCRCTAMVTRAIQFCQEKGIARWLKKN